MSADEILEALIARAVDEIWATELAFGAGARRIDFWSMRPIPSRGFLAQSFEIKVSRADYKRDSEKKQRYALHWSDRFWYVTPPGLIAVDELPDWAGLQEWTGTRFQIARKAPKRPKAEPDWAFIAALLRASGDCRRDVGLMKMQLDYYRSRCERQDRARKIRERMIWDRRLGRAQRRGEI